MNNLLHAPAKTLANLIFDKKISADELLDLHLQRIEEVNPKLNAIVHLDRQRARKEAQAADDAITRGESIGPLHGVPLTIKSCIDVEGLRCECGSRLRQGYVASGDAPLVTRLRAAGAIILGLTNVPELLFAYETDNLLYGRTNSPWNLDYTPGGSSGGESAAISSGCSAAGIGSDGGGSIRVPAHFCGLYGLKPTAGLIPRTGHWPDCIGPSALLASVGPLARSAADLELLLDVTMGEDPDDPSSGPLSPRLWSEPELRETKIGYYEDDGITPVTSETRKAVRRAAGLLSDRGFTVEPYRPTGLEESRQLWWMLFGIAGLVRMKPLIEGREDELHPIVQDLLQPPDDAATATLEEFLQAWDRRDALRSALLAQMREYPVLLCPVASIPAFRHGERSWQIEGRAVSYPRAFSYCQAFNLLGNPSVVAPVGQSPEGLPIGVQLVGRPYDDRRVLALSRILEETLGEWKAPPEE